MTLGTGVGSPPSGATLRLRSAAGLEVALAALVIVLDVAIPTLVVLAMAGISLAIRRQGPRSLGFRRMGSPLRATGSIFVLTLGWTLLQFGLVIPLANRVTGSRQDVSAFSDLEGNTALFLVLLLASWTLAALGEEAVCRGYLPTRVQETVGDSSSGTPGWLAFLLPAALFAALHTEQAAVGVLVTFLDGLFFMWLRVRHDTIWASVLAHGFNNTIGLSAFYLVGPLYGLW